MLNFNEFLSENTKVLLSEAAKKDILDYMSKASWNANESYTFARQAIGHGIFKTENQAMKAFDKYYAEYSKGPKGSATKASWGSDGIIKMVSLNDYMKGGTKGTVSKPAAPKPISTSKAAPTPSVKPTAPATDKSLYNFNTKAIRSKYSKVLDLLDEIAQDGADIKSQFAKIRKGRHINNLETPELYDVYVSVENIGYVASLKKEIRDYIGTIDRFDTKVVALRKHDTGK